ncbi:hypothetical protein CYLTODRAFT_495519, partial [Cylindrobasidium torrendii FP15055 ss-10]
MTIPRWKIHSSVAVATKFAAYAQSCMEALPSQFRPEDFVFPCIMAQRFVMAHVLSAYEAIGHYVPKYEHPDLRTLFLKYDGHEALDLLDDFGVNNLHKFSIMSIIFNQRHDAHIPILMLAMGFGKPTSAASQTLIILMQRIYCHATNSLAHKSLTARIIFQTELQQRIQKMLWEQERDIPMPRWSWERRQEASLEFEAIVKKKLETLPPAKPKAAIPRIRKI